MFNRMRGSFFHLVSSVAPVDLDPLRWVQAIPFVVSRPEIKIPHHAGQYDLQLGHHNTLGNTISGAVLEGAPGILDRM